MTVGQWFNEQANASNLKYFNEFNEFNEFDFGEHRREILLSYIQLCYHNLHRVPFCGFVLYNYHHSIPYYQSINNFNSLAQLDKFENTP